MKSKFSSTVVTVAFLLTIVGCSAPRGLDHKASAPTPYVEKDVSINEQEFANKVGEAMQNSDLVLSWSPKGENVTIHSGSVYINGLGERCKKAFYVQNTVNYQFAVCQNATSGTWRYIEPLE